jgi:hypothetical protein
MVKEKIAIKAINPTNRNFSILFRQARGNTTTHMTIWITHVYVYHCSEPPMRLVAVVPNIMSSLTVSPKLFRMMHIFIAWMTYLFL